jgi:hypothetical protein
MALNYTTYTSQLSNLMVQATTDPNFVTFLPGCIDYAEQRIYRELDLLVTRDQDNATFLSSGNRLVTLASSTGPFIVVEQISVITPVTAGTSNGTRNPLTRVTKEFMDFAWPNSSNTGVPIYYTTIDNLTFVMGPAPNAGYLLEVTATTRPTPLSASNSSTFLTTFLPDVFMAASMVFATAYQRDFGAMVDDPQRAASWESQYKILKESANLEELRKRFMGPAWQAMTPSPVATPARQ